MAFLSFILGLVFGFIGAIVLFCYAVKNVSDKKYNNLIKSFDEARKEKKEEESEEKAE